jgi:hypothetical protein
VHQRLETTLTVRIKRDLLDRLRTGADEGHESVGERVRRALERFEREVPSGVDTGEIRRSDPV